MTAPKVKGLIFLERSNLLYYQEGDSTVYSFSFPATLIQDLEVLSPEELQKQLKTFVDANKLISALLTIVLSDTVTFTRDFPPSTDLQNEAVQQFFNAVPFENGTTKIYKLDKVARAAAVNTDLIDSIRNAFEQIGFIVENAIPLFSLGQTHLSGGFTPSLAKSLLKKSTQMRHMSLIDYRVYQAIKARKEEAEKGIVQQLKSKKMLILGSIFGILVLALIGMIFTTIQKPPDVAQKSAMSQSTKISGIMLSPTQIPISSIMNESTTSGMLDGRLLRAQISNGSGIAGQAESIKKELQALGIKDIQVGNAPGATSPKTLIVFSPRVEQTLRSQIVQSMKKIVSDVSVIESNAAQFDISITTGTTQ